MVSKRLCCSSRLEAVIWTATLLLWCSLAKRTRALAPTFLAGKPPTAASFASSSYRRWNINRSPYSVLYNSNENETSDEPDRTSFDQAGASLIEEEDRKRMEEMGDFDENPAYKNDSIEQMRAALRERTASLGIEKSKVSADYIRAREKAALEGPPPSEGSPDQFAGLDLSKITSDGKNRGEWDEDMPTMFYEPEDEMSIEEQREVDPLMMQNPVSQGLDELKNAKWPTLGAVGREVLIMGAVVALTALLIIGADRVLRFVYTDAGLIPSPEDLANYAARFDGLDLPSGWTDNMNESDVAQFAEKVNAGSSVLPEL